MARPAVVSPLIYDKVNKLVAEESLSKAEAFKLIAEKSDEFGIPMTGKSEGTVAASYYRENRKRLAGTSTHEGPGGENGSRSKTRKATTPSTNSDELIAKLTATLHEAANFILAQNKELQEERAKHAQMRQLLGGE